jgi:hypothetical protein
MLFSGIFFRKNVNSTIKINEWWRRGQQSLNVAFIIYVALHMATSWLVFNKSFLFALILPIIFIGLLINLIFVVGVLIELSASKIFKFNIDFNRYAPLLKKCLFILAALFVISLSVVDLLQS